MIAERIRSLIESKLNDNTYNKRFVVGSYVYLEDEQRGFIYNVKNGYTLVETNFIPSMMVFTAEYQPMPTQINGNAVIPMTFLLAAETQEQFELDLTALDEVIEKIVGNSEKIVDGSKVYNSVWNMSALMPKGATSPINGVYYTQIDTTIYVSFSDTNHYGNEYEYYLNRVRVLQYDLPINRNNEPNNPHLLGDTEAKGGNSTSVWSTPFTFYVNDFLSQIIDTFSADDYNMEQVYLFKEITPTNQTGHEFAVKISSATYNPSLGEKVLATIEFIKSDEAFSETEYNITYELDGGTNNVSNPATFTVDDIPLTLYDATKVGYTFDGWYATEDLSGLPITELVDLEDTTIYAKWTFVPYYDWQTSDETYWNEQNALGNAGTEGSTVDPNVSPDTDPSTLPIGFAMRCSDGSLPTTYYYYKTAYITE